MVCVPFIPKVSSEKTLVLKDKHTKSKKRMIIKGHKKVSIITIYVFLVPSTYAFFNKFGGLSTEEIGEVLLQMEEKRLNINDAARLINGTKHLRYVFSFSHLL